MTDGGISQRRAKRLLSRKACVGMFISACAETNQRRRRHLLHLLASGLRRKTSPAARCLLFPKNALRWRFSGIFIPCVHRVPAGRQARPVGKRSSNGANILSPYRRNLCSVVCCDDDAWVLWCENNVRFLLTMLPLCNDGYCPSLKSGAVLRDSPFSFSIAGHAWLSALRPAAQGRMSRVRCSRSR